MLPSEIKCTELFAGGGGMTYGLICAGIHPLYLSEINTDCCATLDRNLPGLTGEYTLFRGDVRLQDFSGIKNDLVTGGFPCQAFSTAGRRLGFADTRGTLFYEFARCVKETNPRLFIAENVKGLLSHDGGHTFAVIKDVFGDLGYSIDARVLNAWEYGVPQKRERVIIAGVRNDCGTEFPWPEKVPESERKTLGDALKNCPPSAGASYGKTKKEIMEHVPEGGNWRDLPEEMKKKYMGKMYAYTENGVKSTKGGMTGVAKRLSMSVPAPTMLCSPCQKQTERCHPTETRPLTVRETARVQTFPDSWEFCGGTASQYAQIGNAVPCLLAEKLGRSAAEFLGRYGTET